ncbi:MULTISPECIES: 1-acyl-sn-glycerol-3-phosphate acyltransferase [Thermoactinomyces]|jgi:1-acyl-sn-glycerol-3-phosphate acyltransferase|uniref:1-acyl-sn-glycerol-3-phosphate acyltransferase n=2 Tax=Thermoactinomyces vulgaris TaxID=2026 RepID=A0ABS0QED6_THEVU|nr:MULTISPECIES: lysophospholipid acyltransferase family protein [Thermoactinomyces]KFZ40547.1 acyl-phosphate glycerol 3-phosphate acyltransferase [Thermoactinomyces sp. Gus2-1]KYQ87828.1 acyl-phosphate glycerol 3-phosphate acyltransferase [Thermoactinomyces sp. AS95]MBA4550407.1 1-acyl-sn-glycerol-3-phosphate acyltransferase [Thermoactinomyces vulgaris]MBA4595818.1 1-acyl-sn-glycerol-3-phosphate acyltransferase [Thermoactinomyces vulgaris]MBH8582291.1 1-acyl-sn-glycerol-3-phosphate acyltransf
MLYRVSRAIVRFLMALLYPFKSEGEGHIPKEGPVVLCSNHISNLDPPLVGITTTRQVYFMAKEELFRIPVLSGLIHRFGAFPVKRGAGDLKSLKTAIQLLKDGKVVGIFPEGTRSKSGELLDFHVGAALVALKGKAPIVPVNITGPYRLFRPVKITYGPPIDITPYLQEKANMKTAKQLTERVMEEIRSMQNENRE